MVFQKMKELYEPDGLVAEVFRENDFVALLSKAGLCLKNRHYSTVKKDVKDHILLREHDFRTVLQAIERWKQEKDSLWGRIAHGHSWCGYLGSDYYPPHSKEKTYVEKGQSKEHLNVGKLEERIRQDDIEFVFERFRLGIERGNQRASFDAWQVPLIENAFLLYDARKDIYLPPEEPIDIEEVAGWHGLY